jgi:hypothetical protein
MGSVLITLWVSIARPVAQRLLRARAMTIERLCVLSILFLTGSTNLACAASEADAEAETEGFDEEMEDAEPIGKGDGFGGYNTCAYRHASNAFNSPDDIKCFHVANGWCQSLHQVGFGDTATRFLHWGPGNLRVLYYEHEGCVGSSVEVFFNGWALDTSQGATWFNDKASSVAFFWH